MTTYSSIQDYVICGAGSAGCVLANPLSVSSTNSLLLLEAGPKDKKRSLYDDNNILHYYTVPQKNLDNRVLYCPRGRVLGGTSSINGMVYMRGHAYDYDRWEDEGAKGWSYADCLPYFKKAQTHELDTASAYLGTTMQWFRQKHLRMETEALVTRILFEGNKAIGVEYKKDGKVMQEND